MTIPVRTVGSGPHHVFCLHGWFGHSGGWGAFPDYLDGEAFTYHFTDNRGYGARKHESGDYSLDEVAGDVIAAADEQGADTFSLIGHSMGGAEVLRVLTTVPDRVRKVVGISGVGASPGEFDEAGRELFWGAAEDPEKRFAIIDYTTGNRLTTVWIRQMVDSSLAHSTKEAFAGALEMWANPDFLHEVRGNPTPTLAIAGEHDPALGEPAVRAAWEAHLPSCRVHVMANAGHYSMHETPVALATTVESFLAG